MPDPVTMLALLGSGVRAIKGIVGGATPKAPGEPIDFEKLLSKAQRGEGTSGLRVHEAPGVDAGMSEAESALVSVAVDRAEAQGAVRAAVVLDGRVLTVDVASRTVVEVARGSASGVMTGVDAVIDVRDGGFEPAAGDVSETLLRVLASKAGRGAA